MTQNSLTVQNSVRVGERITDGARAGHIADILRGVFFMALALLMFIISPVGHRPYWKRALRDWRVWAMLVVIVSAVVLQREK